mgnify:CR=1 FL=1
MNDKIYSFIMKGELTKALLKQNMPNRHSSSNLLVENYHKSLSIDLLDEEYLQVSTNMSIVYIAISTFENMVRQFIKKILIEKFEDEWISKGISEKIVRKAKNRQNEDANTKWHTQRGGDIIDYIDFDDLSKIISQNLELFKDYIYSPEWANTIFNTLNKSRNVIMHSGELSKEDIERIRMNIRDWIRQVGN